jgi:hypothetical protein
MRLGPHPQTLQLARSRSLRLKAVPLGCGRGRC